MIAATFTAPSVDYFAVAPMLVVFGAAMLGVCVEAFADRKYRYDVQVAVTLVGLIAALIVLVWYLVVDNDHVTTANKAVVIDGPTLFLQAAILVLALLSVLAMVDRTPETGGAFTPQASAVPGSPEENLARRVGLTQSEVFPLALFSIGGMLLFPAAGDLLTMFIALEVLSLPLYLMCGLARRRRLLSQEASLKYFLLGAFSSAFFLYGAALLYGYAGSIRLSDIASVVANGSASSNLAGQDGLLLLGAVLVAVGLLFKVGAVPFHTWTPDVYQGAPTPVTGFMAACTKLAAFGALLRVAYVALPGLQWDWQPALVVVAILTMIVGSVVAIVQADVKRMLAYSSIAHAGFLLVGLLALDKSGVSSVLFYLTAYGFATVGAFALVTLVRTTTEDGGVGGEATHLSQWQGLGRKSPLVAGAFTLFLISFAGIPLTSGFVGKYTVFTAALQHGGPLLGMGRSGAVLVIVGVLASAAAAFFYVRVIVLMYFSDPVAEGTRVSVPGIATTFTVVVGAAATVVLGIYPSVLLDLADKSAVFLP